jgi:hypothetical protein
VPEKAKQAASVIVDKAVDKAKKESGSTASAVKSFIAGMFATLLIPKGCELIVQAGLVGFARSWLDIPLI